MADVVESSGLLVGLREVHGRINRYYVVRAELEDKCSVVSLRHVVRSPLLAG